MMSKIKILKQLECIIKGAANHYRIEILFLLAKENALTLETIIEILNANRKTISEHTHRLCRSGLIYKKYHGRFVEHTLSAYGKRMVQFLKQFQKT